MAEFRLPSLGADMDSGTLLQWKVQPGDAVHKGQVVAVVDTSKAAIDVEIWQEGTVQALQVQPGETIPVGTVMALLRAPGEAEGTPPVPTASSPVAPPATGRQRVSPAARQRARVLGVNLATLAGSGADGAITLADVERAGQAPAMAVAVPTGPAHAPARGSDRQAETRRAIAGAMSRSKREIPHYYLLETIPLARAQQWLAQANADRPITERLLIAALQLKAVALALQGFPELNGFYLNGAFQPAPTVHLGVAVSLRQGGLIAPALHDVTAKPLDALMRELTDLVRRTRAGSLRSSELSDASITVTNLGEQGPDAVLGIIQPPQVALVGFGRVAPRPWVDEQGALTVLPTVTASLSADHRVSDGHRGGLFLRALAERLQDPEALAR